MSDKLVTLAIRTYQRAQMIKHVLEQKKIPTEIHNLNLEQPEIAVGVRVRIKECDLPRALKIVEMMEMEWENNASSVEKTDEHILVPINVNDVVPQLIDYGFYFAQKLNAEVCFLYVYFSPMFSISSSNDLSTYSINDSDMFRQLVAEAHSKIELLTQELNTRIAQGQLPNIPFRFELKEGVPEELITDFAKKNKPLMMVMGARGKKNQKEIIGSVTAEVMEEASLPIFAVPVDAPTAEMDKVKRIAFLTNFDQHDLIAIDHTISIVGDLKCEMFFVHASDTKDSWDEVMLAGIKSYFSSHYPNVKTNYELISSPESLAVVQTFLQQNKIDVLAFNIRRRNMFARLFNPSLSYKMVLSTDIPIYISHVN